MAPELRTLSTAMYRLEATGKIVHANFRHYACLPPPPANIRYRALMASIKMEELSFPSNCQIEPYLVNLLHRMLDKNPKTRITLDDVMDHEWVTKEGVCPSQPGRSLEIPTQERVRSHSHSRLMTGRWGTDEKVVRPHAIAVDSEGSNDAGAGDGSNAFSKNTLIRNSRTGPTTKRHAGSTKHPEKSSLAGGAGEVGHRGGEKTESTPFPFSIPSCASPSRPYHSSSLSKREQISGGKDEQLHHKQKQKQKQQQQHATKGGGREGMGCCRSFDQEEAAVTTARVDTKIDVEDEDENDVEEETNVWSDGDDKVPSPRMLEAIVDKG